MNYVSKYMTKKDIDNPEYTGKVLRSPGLGAGYVKRIGKDTNGMEKTQKKIIIQDKEHISHYQSITSTCFSLFLFLSFPGITCVSL